MGDIGEDGFAGDKGDTGSGGDKVRTLLYTWEVQLSNIDLFTHDYNTQVKYFTSDASGYDGS